MTVGRPTARHNGTFACVVVTCAVLTVAPSAADTAQSAQSAQSAQTSAGAPSTASAVSAASILQRWPVLRQGPNSDWPQATVRSLQYLLRARGASIRVDGTFGQQTKAAVVSFQRNRHLTLDGVVGSTTWRALIITVQQGSRGDAVRAVQDQINFRDLKDGHTVDVDGIFGPRTRRAVIGFQQTLAIDIKPFAVDGIVGPQTWPPLVNEANSG